MTGELAVGLVLGWLDGAAEIDGFSDGIEDGMADSGLQRSFGERCTIVAQCQWITISAHWTFIS